MKIRRVLGFFYELVEEESTFGLIKGTTTEAGDGCRAPGPMAFEEDEDDDAGTTSCEESSMFSTTVSRSSSWPGESKEELLLFKSSKVELFFCCCWLFVPPTPGIVGILLLPLPDDEDWDAETITVAG